MDRFLSFLIRIIVLFSGLARHLAKLGIGSYEAWEPGEKLKLLIVGYNGARNTGADARVIAITEQLRELFGPENVQITVMTLDRESLAGYFPEDVVLQEFSSIFLLDLYRACSSHHAAVLSEGSTLKSTFANGLTLFLCEAAGIMSKQKKPCIAYGSEIGEMEDFLKKTAVDLCRDCYFITRTEDSQKALEQLGLRGHCGTDTAWTYQPGVSAAEIEPALVEAGWDGSAELLGAAVIDPFCWPVRASLFRWLKGFFTGDRSGRYDKWYYFSDSPARREAFRQYIAAFAAALDRFAEERNCFPVVIGMERLDEKACKALQAALHRRSALFLSGNTDAARMTAVLGKLSYLVTSRYHASVLSMVSGIPITAVSMDERLDNLMREMSFDRLYLHHVSDADLSEEIYASLCSGAAHRAEIRAQIDLLREGYLQKLSGMGAFLKDYLSERL
jgi:polysaccharide pyruvyl transferase WcaK-like protein